VVTVAARRANKDGKKVKQEANVQETNQEQATELTRLEVTIFGNKYTMRAGKDATKMLKVVDLVNDTMEAVAKRQPKLAYKEICVLAALNLAEQLVDTEEEYQNLREIMEENQKESEL